jgi:NAD+ synthetase
MRVAILQLNPILGGVSRNCKTLIDQMRAHAGQAELYVTPELALIGYPPQDLLSLKDVLEAEQRALAELQNFTAKFGVGLLVGHTESRKGAPGRPLYNSASLFDRGALLGQVRKQRPPSYDIFDERRYIEEWREGPQPLLNFRGRRIGISICEDAWDKVRASGINDVREYRPESNPLLHQGDAELLINISASPYTLSKRPQREKIFAAQARKLKRPLVYANCVGGQDGVLFDGGSFALNAKGEVVAQARLFAEDLVTVELDGRGDVAAAPVPETRNLEAQPFEMWGELWSALKMGLSDFVRKTSQKRVLLGLSGGIDSALVAALASEALGPEKVLGVSLPSRLTSDLSKSEAAKLAKSLGIEFRELSIAPAVEAHTKSLGLAPSGLAYENLQSRNRGLMLMALSNSEQRMLLATGNKSELAMGYSTLYGDLCGGLLPLGDLYKSEVYGLSHRLCAEAEARGREPPIPLLTRTRPPTAELAQGQLDTDSLPSYDILDALLFELIENQGQVMGSLETWNRLLKPKDTKHNDTVEGIFRRFHGNEFKRHQAAPLLKVHQRSLGPGWIFPIAKELAWGENLPS